MKEVFNAGRVMAIVVVCAAALTMVFSCTGEADRLRSQNDSIAGVNSRQQTELDQLTDIMAAVSMELDSMAVAEGVLKRNIEQGNTKFSKRDIIGNLTAMKDLLAQNRTRIADLEKQLASMGNEYSKLSAVVRHLNNELSQKETTINKLYSIISERDATIADLQGQVSKLSDELVESQEEALGRQEVIDNQDKELHEVYYVVGTSSQLKKKKLLTKKFLGSKKINVNELDKSLFQVADLRELKEIPVSAKSAKVRTAMPASSYEIVQNADNTCVLKIKDPAEFWSQSRYLIVEMK